MVLDDQVKEEAKELINLLHKDKVEVVLLTGGHQNNAKAIANELGIDRYYAELLPEDKTVPVSSAGSTLILFSANNLTFPAMILWPLYVE